MKNKKFNKKIFFQSVFNMVKDSEFMESVIIELLDAYDKNTDEQNYIEFEYSLLDDLMNKAIELEWYEVCARIQKHKNKLDGIEA